MVESYGDTRVALAAHLANEPKKYAKYGEKDDLVTVSDEWAEWNAERKDMQGQLEGMEVIQERFDRTGTSNPPGDTVRLPEAYLLGFDPKGQGRAILANGNPDEADHTAVFVPGTKSSFAESRDQIERSEYLWQETYPRSGDSKVSTITWIGYDAPQSALPVVEGDADPEARSPSYAYDAAPALNQFMAGLETAQGGAENSHTTLIGHSYGSTAIGAASLKGDLAVDDIVAVGSPGMLVNHADKLDVDQGHVWSQAAAVHSDPVPLLGRVVGLGNDIQSPLDYLTQRVPSEEEFGANIMATNAKDHGDYWEQGSVSIENQASVILGQYDEVKR